MNNWWGEIFFISRFIETSLKETWNKFFFSIEKSIEFYSFDVKVTKKSRLTFCENIEEEKKGDNINYFLWRWSKHKFSKMDLILSRDFTSNILQLHEPKTGGKRKVWYNFPALTRLKLPKFPRT